MVEVLSFNPARIFGFYPRKGPIIPGSDADLVLFDPKVKKKLSAEGLHMNVDYNIYEGLEIEGYRVATLVRENLVTEDGQFVGRCSEG